MRTVIIFACLLITSSTAVAADSDSDSLDVRAKHALLERLALVLTGQLPNPAVLSDYINGSKTLLESARRMKDTELFEERLSYYYQEVLSIIQPLDFLQIYTFPLYVEIDEFHNPHHRNSRIKASYQLMGGEHQVFKDTINGDHATLMRYIDRLNNPRKFNLHKKNKVSIHLGYNLTNKHYFMSLFRGKEAELIQVLESKSEYAPLLQELHSAQHCKGLEIEVTPYWSDQPVKACPSTIESKYCGIMFQDCFPYPNADVNRDPSNHYRNKIAAALTLEPSRMIAKTVREGKKYSSILTTSKGLVNGYLLHYLKNFDPIFRKQYQRYQRFNDNELNPENRVVYITKPNDYPNIANALPKVNITDKKYYWIERGGSHHAGILTTFAFHRATNGRRAKANKARAALLCRDFADHLMLSLTQRIPAH